MNHKKFKNELNVWKVPKLSKEQKEDNVTQIVNTLDCKHMRMNTWEFIISQICFIQKRAWILQLLLIPFIAYITIQLSANTIGYLDCCMITLTAPFIFLVAVEEIVRIYNVPMLEMEMASKVSLGKALLTRLIIFVVTDGILLILFSFIVSSLSNLLLIQILCYCFVPFLGACIISLKMMQCISGKKFRYGQLVTMVLSAVAWMILSVFWEVIFSPDSLIYWGIAFTFLLLVGLNEILKFYQKINYLELY